MLKKDTLEKLATKYQTSYRNISRECIQNLFLRSFYTKEGSENFLFKGGTALRIVFKSPRFSEDLDFSGYKNGGTYEKVLENVLLDLVSEGLDVDIEESKVTSGGYLANIVVNFEGEKITIKNQISFRDKSEKKLENMLISSDVVPSYNIFLLHRSIIVAEKINALIERAKPRDFFDLHYILANHDLRKEMVITKDMREKIIIKINSQDKKHLKTELKNFLPNSFWKMIDDLPSFLKRDI